MRPEDTGNMVETLVLECRRLEARQALVGIVEKAAQSASKVMGALTSRLK